LTLKPPERGSSYGAAFEEGKDFFIDRPPPVWLHSASSQTSEHLIMAFCFKRKESVPKAIRRLGCERVEHALECLKHCRGGEAIHCARKDIKKMRALLRLVRAEISRKEFRLLTKPLWKAAKFLAAPRDAHVKTKTLINLVGHFKGQLATGALRHFRSELRNAFDQEMMRFAKEKTANAVHRLLRRVGKELEQLEISGKGWKALSPGVKTAYADGMRAYQRSCKNPSAENFHLWRKRAKELWYQVLLLRRVWPEQMDAMAEELETLGENLGEDHDLVMLQATAGEMYAAGHLPELKALIGLIDERQHELRSAATTIGARFYAEKPSAFCKRLAGYWRIWCREKSPSTVSLKQLWRLNSASTQGSSK